MRSATRRLAFGAMKPADETRQWFVSATAGLVLLGGAALLDGRSGLVSASALLGLCITFLVLTSLTLGTTRSALALLVVASLINRYAVTLGGLHLKPETVAVPLVGLVVVGELAAHRRLPRLTLVDWLLGAWIVANGLGSLYAPLRGTSLKLTVQLALLCAGSLAIRQLIRSGVDLRVALAVMLGGLTVVAAIGVVAYVLYPLGPNLGIQIDPITHRPTAYATLFEGNLFGSSIMVGWFWWLVALLTGTSRRWLAVLGLAITTAGVEVSLARGTWLAIAVTLLVAGIVLLANRPRSMISLSPHAADLGLAAFTALVLSAIVLLSPGSLVVQALHRPAVVGNTTTAGAARGGTVGSQSASPAIIQRATTLSEPGADATVTQRLEIVRSAVRDWRVHPLTGLGPGSYGESHIDTSHQPAWIGILPVRILHDTGILGTVVFLAFGVVLARRWLAALRACAAAWLRAALIAQGLGLIALLIAYTATEGLELLFAWVVLGLLVATIEVVQPGVTDSPATAYT